MSLLNIGSNALSNAAAGANNASKNISNINTEGYVREEVRYSTGPSNYVFVNIERMTDNFTSARFRSAISQMEFESIFSSKLSQVNEAVTAINSDGEGGYSNALSASANDIYQSMIKLSSDDSLPNRELFLSSLESFTQIMRNAGDVIGEIKDGSTEEFSRGVEEINTSLYNLDEINKKISSIGDGADASLLNQRDQVVDKISELIGVGVEFNDNGTVNITTNQGVDILDQSGPRDILGSYDNQSDTFSLNIGGSDVSGSQFNGKVGGIVTSYEAIKSIESDLGALYYSLVTEINSANASGFTESGAVGGDLISLPSLVAKGSEGNSLLGSVTVDSYDHTVSQSTRFTVERTATGFEVTDLNSGSSTTYATMPFSYKGVQVSESGAIQIGDAFTVDPMSEMMSGGTIVGDYDDIALSNQPAGGSGNTENAKVFTDVFDNKMYNGGSENYHTYMGTTLSRIGETAQSADGRRAIAETNLNSATSLREQVQGVDLNEENISLIQYQSAYQAASKIITTHVKLMDSLLGAF